MLARRLPGILPALAPDEALEVTRIHSVAGLLLPRPAADRIAAVPRAAPQRLGGGRRRRRTGPTSRRGEPRPSRRAAARRAAGIRAARARGTAPAAGGRDRQHRPRTGDGALPCPLPARGDDEPLFLRRAGDPAVECTCSAQRLAAFRDKLSRALLDRFDLVVTVPRPLAQELAAPPAEPSSGAAARVAGARVASRVAARRAAGGGTADACRRAPASLGPRTSARCACGPDGRGVGRLRAGKQYPPAGRVFSCSSKDLVPMIPRPRCGLSIDLGADDIEAEATRLVGLGAQGSGAARG